MRAKPKPITAASPLASQALEAAESEHRARVAEIKALAPSLAQLDEIHPALQLVGLRIYPSQLRLRREPMGHGRSRSVLRIDTGGLFLSRPQIEKWLAALLTAGFAEVSRDSCSCAPTALLKRGTVYLRVDVCTAAAAAAAAAPAPAPKATAGEEVPA